MTAKQLKAILTVGSLLIIAAGFRNILPTSSTQTALVYYPGPGSGTISPITLSTMSGDAIPSAPSLILYFVPPTDISLSWTAPSGTIWGYRIYRNNQPYTSVGSSSKLYTDPSPLSGAVNSYQVSAFNDAGESARSNSSSATTSSLTFRTGQVVETTSLTNVYNIPITSENSVASLPTTSVGIISNLNNSVVWTTQGIYNRGDFWWNVTFAGGVQGWVQESNIVASSAAAPETCAAPMYLNARVISAKEVDLTWKYNGTCPQFTVYRNGTFLAETSQISFVDTSNLTPSTNFDYAVTSHSSTVESARSEISSVTTPPANSTKFAVGDQVSIATSNAKIRALPGINLRSRILYSALPVGTIGNITATSSDNQGIYANNEYWWYVTFPNGMIGWIAESSISKYIASVPESVGSTNSANSNTSSSGSVSHSGSYLPTTYYYVWPINSLNLATNVVTNTVVNNMMRAYKNTSEPPVPPSVSSFNFSSHKFSIDETAPSTPENLSAIFINSNLIQLFWNDATDNIGVTGYKVFRNGRFIATTSSSMYSDYLSVPDNSYAYTVSAFDAMQNESAQSAPSSVAIPEGSLTLYQWVRIALAKVRIYWNDFTYIAGMRINNLFTSNAKPTLN